MRLVSRNITRRFTDRVGSALDSRLEAALPARAELLRRGRSAVATASGAVREAASTLDTERIQRFVPGREPPPSRSGRQRAAVAIVAVTVTAVVVTGAYIWWRRNRDKEYALLQSEPERPNVEPASPLGEPGAPEVPVAGGPVPSVEEPTEREPARPVAAPVGGTATSEATASGTARHEPAAYARPSAPRRAEPVKSSSSARGLPSSPTATVPHTGTQLPPRPSGPPLSR